MRVYIAGPMRGYPLYNFPAFDAAAEALREAGHDPINPADLDRARGVDERTDPLPPGFIREALREDLLAILDEAEAIALLPGWMASRGAVIEVALARAVEIPVVDVNDLSALGREGEADHG